MVHSHSSGPADKGPESTGSEAPQARQIPSASIFSFGSLLDQVAETHAVGSQHSSLRPPSSVPNAEAQKICAAFWSEATQRASTPKATASVNQHKLAIQQMLAASIPDEHYASHADRIFHAVIWYKQQMDSGSVPHGDFSKLPLFGVIGEKISPAWGRLVELAQFYVRESKCEPDFGLMSRQFERRANLRDSVWQRFTQSYHFPDDAELRAEVSGRFFRTNNVSDDNQATLAALLRHEFLQAAKLRLAQALGGKKLMTNELDAFEPSILLNFDFVDAHKSTGLLAPNFKTLVDANRAIRSGGTGFLFCCPDYARKQQPDGSYNYTMDGLGTGCGLTAERSIPIATALIARAAELAKLDALPSPISFRIGVADFEATRANAELTNCGSVEEFERRLNSSVNQITARIVELLPSTLEIDVTLADSEDLIHQRTLRITEPHSNNVIALVEVGRVTAALLKDKEGDGTTSTLARFNTLVETKREHLVGLAEKSAPIQKQIDTLILLRMDLLVKWSGPDAPEYVQELKSQVPVRDKASVLRAMQAQLASGDISSKEAQALLYMRRKVAIQGAEYAVMHELMNTHNSPYHLAADALNMWQVFGKKSIPIIGIRGLYAGADLVDLQQS
jgi:hypothetical protein